ncbi:DUF2637 domain-containing protein [Nonomuraea bangladeshensis]|uniref:DUF2637 domain-containing protein n=1 Tax=Nonomuraea bangladeshensis TaxID=404385 RepID=UPI0031D90080
METAETKPLDGKLVLMIVIAVLALVAVVVGAFVLSYDALTAVAKAAHIAESLAWLMSVSVDGAMTVGTMAALVLKMLGKPTRYAWFVVLAGVLISVLCNALHATQSQGGKVILDPWQAGAVSAIPAVALALSLHLLIILIEAISDAVRGRSKTPDEPRTGEVDEPVRTLTTEAVRVPSVEPVRAIEPTRTEPVRVADTTPVRTARTDAPAPVQPTRTAVPVTPEPARTETRKATATPAPAPSQAVKSPKTLVKTPPVPVERDALVAELAWAIRATGDDWSPDYDDLMARSGYGRSWCEKVVRDARKAARSSEPPAPRTDARTDAVEARTDDPYGTRTETPDEPRTDEADDTRTDSVRARLRAVN